ncbi:hypothetical protein A3Q56_00340 [Intoshia linei]|uniref:28S ribosomal protein S30, mitochondrial n=1 Tax=Intoshia linei TaxID=1819745 RepID=A0A177BE99_9BILA|nr:hypothetical protein A3Q56_00340 [Intoshia linei]
MIKLNQMLSIAKRYRKRNRYKVKTRTYPNFLSLYNENYSERNMYKEIQSKYPPGNFQDLSEKDAWSCYNYSQKLISFPQVLDRLELIDQLEVQNEYILNDKNLWPQTYKYTKFLTNTSTQKWVNDTDDTIKLKYSKLSDKISNMISEEYTKINHLTNLSSENVCSLKEMQQYDFSKRLLSRILNFVYIELCKDSSFIENVSAYENLKCHAFFDKLISHFEEKNDIEKFTSFSVTSSQDFVFKSTSPVLPFVQFDKLPKMESFQNYEKYQPSMFDIKKENNRKFINTGTKIHDPYECTLSIFNVESLEMMKTLKEMKGYHMDGTTQAAVEKYQKYLWNNKTLLSCFISTFATCYNFGYNSFTQLINPLPVSAFMFDGKYIQPYRFQLNDIQLWRNAEHTKCQNLFWIGEKMKLYNKISQDGQIDGFNILPIFEIINCLTRQRLGLDKMYTMKPHLKKSHNVIVNRDIFYNVKKLERREYPNRSLYY